MVHSDSERSTSTLPLRLKLVLASAVISGSLVVGGASLSRADHSVAPPAGASGVASSALSGLSGPYTIADAAERALPAVVNISTTRTRQVGSNSGLGPFGDDPFFRRFFGDPGPDRGGPREHREKSLGSGVIVSPDGVVLTNNHVVAEADDIRVTLSDGREFEATVLGNDAPSDIAVLRLGGQDGQVFPFLSLGDSAAVRLGEIVIAVGNPFGLEGSVTMGIVSAKGRADVGIVDYEDFIQTDAAINPGNSGGALVSLAGELVGINTAIASRSGGYQGVGFAIPSNMAAEIMQRLIDDGVVARGWLGIHIQDLSADMSAAFGVDGQDGVLVAGVAPKSPAGRAGIERGDIIVGFQNRSVSSAAGLRNLVALEGVGTPVSLSVIRDGRSRVIAAKLGAIPGQSKPVVGSSTEEGAGLLEGLTLGPLTEDRRSQLDLADDVQAGLVVLDLAPGSAAAASGLRRGDVIVELNRKSVRSLKGLERIRREPGEQLLALVVRGKASFYVLVG
ncbi:MAG TPA: hypothetical protein DIU15_14020 [Deltaproteobacteria bacterium]|nr:hypothetical protein [Deltaproteobacteria bacterium]HCP47155.1 hypothetical protein [Deltaproteobacteria bacterium]